MSFFQTWVERLNATRQDLSDNTVINDPTNYSKQIGTMDFLFNPSLNPRTIDVQQNQNSAAGKYRSVEITYQPQWGTDDLETDDSAVSCGKNSQVRDIIDTYDVNLFAYHKFTLEEDYIRQTDPNTQARLAKGFRNSMRIGRESMDKQLLAKMAANMGSNPAAGAAAGAYTTVQLLSSGAANVNSFDTFANHRDDNFMGGPIAIIGLGNARNYFNRLAVGNLNTNAGVDIMEIANQFGGLFYKDHATTAVLGGANRVLVAYAGLTQFYGYNLYKGEFAKQSPDNLIKGTMADPIYPFDWDYKIHYDDNCETGNGLQGAWVVEVFKYFDLFTTPPEAFGTVYGSLNGFTGIVGYNVTSA